MEWNLSAAEREVVKEEWFNACKLIKLDPKISSDWWLTLSARYDETHRRYHTLAHIHFMLYHYNKHCAGVVAKHLEVVFAIFFHE